MSAARHAVPGLFSKSRRASSVTDALYAARRWRRRLVPIAAPIADAIRCHAQTEAKRGDQVEDTETDAYNLSDMSIENTFYVFYGMCAHVLKEIFS